MLRYANVLDKERHLSSWKRDIPDHRDQLMSVSWMQRLKQTAKASLRGSGLIVEDQAEIGSCTCNSGTTSVEFALKKLGISIQLSRLWLYAKVREYEGTPLSEDSGAQIRNVMKVLALYGCPSEISYPYDLTKWMLAPPPILIEEASKHKVMMYFRCNSIPAIRASILQGFPVVGGFSVPKNMFSDYCLTTGIVKVPGPNESWQGGHAVLFTGYDDSTKLLEFQNSWSDAWGDGGYGYLPYEYFTNSWADDFWTIRRSS